MVDGGRPLLRENFAESDPPPLKTLITIRSSRIGRITPGEKVQLTRAFQ